MLEQKVIDGLYLDNKSLIKRISTDNELDTILLQEPYWETTEGDKKIIDIEETLYNGDLYGLSNFVRDIANKPYGKYEKDNLYVLQGAGMKEVDFVNVLFEYQNGEISKEEMLESMQELINEEKKDSNK